MEKGALIGRGLTAEVYEWGQDKVLKLFFSKYNDAWIQSEANIGLAVYKAGLPAPAVFDIIDVEGRKGIVFEKISGRSMLKVLETEPWMAPVFLQQIAHIQYGIHQYSIDTLPTQKERFTANIIRSSAILGDRTSRILDYVDKLPDGNSVCHGDLHVNNIIMSAKGPVVIDWASAYKGNPLSDVARSNIMISSPSLPIGVPPVMSLFTHHARMMASWTYLGTYMNASKARFEDIDAWLLPTAAVRLKDKIPGEEKWLMDIIDERLSKINNKS